MYNQQTFSDVMDILTLQKLKASRRRGNCSYGLAQVLESWNDRNPFLSRTFSNNVTAFKFVLYG